MPDGEVVVYAMFRDVTDRKRAEDELRKQKEILEKIFDHVPVMIRFMDPDRRIQMVNREWERTLGWSLQEIQEQNLDVFAHLYPDPLDYQRVQDSITQSGGAWTDCRTT